MNKETLINVIGNKFTNLSEIKDQRIFRAEYMPNGKPAGVFYFDFDDNVIPDDLKEYQDNLLVNDYYNHPGYLQWNYYLIFLRNSFDERTKRKVETNDIYTRKYLLQPGKLKKFLSYSKSEKIIHEDVVVEWRRKLDEIELNEIYSYVPVTEVRDRFLNFSVIKEYDGNNSREDEILTDALVLGKIDKLILKDNYRLYPLERHFDFGRVNLINGVNGVGKTSLLEAIELILCGKTLRNPDTDASNNSIEAFYNNGSINDHYSANNNSKYRQRDLWWYKNDYIRGNKLYESFNRYNFFCSDAAFDYQNNGSASSTIENLKKVALGSEFGRIKSRLRTLNGYLWPYVQSYHIEIDECNSKVAEADEILTNITNNSQESDVFKTFQQQCKEMGWKKPLPNSVGDELNTIGQEISECYTITTSIKKFQSTGNLRSFKDWFEENEKLTKAIADIEAIELKKKRLLDEQKATNEQISKAKYKIDILNEVEKYFLNPSSFSLEGLDNTISTFENQKKKFTSLFDEFLKLNLSLLADDSLIVKNIKVSVQSDIANFTNELSGNEIRLAALKSSLNSLQRIVVEIKSKGREYLNYNNAATECPLCENDFKETEVLASRINKVVSQLTNSLQVEELERRQQEVKVELNSRKEVNETLSRLSQLAMQFYDNENIENYSIGKLLIDLRTLEAKVKDINNHLEDHLNTKSKLNFQGLNEQDLKEIKSRLLNVFSSLSFDSNGMSKFKELQHITSNEMSELNLTVQENNRLMQENDERYLSVLDNFSIVSNENDEGLRQLKERKSSSEQAVILFNKMKNIFEFKEDDDIAFLNVRIDGLMRSLSEIRRIQNSSEQRNKAERLKVDSDTKKKEIEPKLKRLERALEVANEIVGNQDEEEILKDFINSNSKEISEIFSSIHAPHEFTEISFAENRIFLKHIDSQNRSIKEISSGQRSALVLSIFLTLNKQLKDGPNILLFDDPVVFTDDLNVLSFLDYLRQLVINENKQIFFATANKKLAGLFEKKFSFLNDDEFKKFTLKRE